MKKTLAFLLSLGLTVSMLAGCGSKTNETTAAADAQTESAADEKESGADEMQQRQHLIRLTRLVFCSMSSMMHWMLPTKDFLQHWMILE